MLFCQVLTSIIAPEAAESCSFVDILVLLNDLQAVFRVFSGK